MKQMLTLAAMAGLLFFASCTKSSTTTTCTPKEPAVEDTALTGFNSRNGITAIKHSSGIYYQILAQGTGAAPTATSNVRVQYIGKLMNGTIFDSNLTGGGAAFNLQGVIQGWQIGIPLIQSGGKIRLVIPSKYCYGCRGSGTIPADSPLYFEVTLLAVY